MAESKVQFNLKNVYYAVLTETETGGVYTESWSTPVAVKGAVSLDLAQEGGLTPFYADGIKYYISQANAGYSGSLTLARIPDSMLKDIWQMTEDSNKVYIEDVNAQYKEFALMFQIDGDQNDQLFTFYKCSATRPSISSKTNEDTKEPQTQSIDLTISPLRSNGRIMAKTGAETTTSVHSGWFGAVYTS